MKNAWLNYSKEEIKEINNFGNDYKDFLSQCKTERECTEKIIKEVEAKGFKNLEKLVQKGKKLNPGDKIYVNNRDKSLALFIIGKEDITNGMNILGAHIDSPRLDVKSNPLYEESEFSYLDTHYYGGIKKYQWVTLPLALHGIIVKKDGTKIHISIGEKENDPVFGITDLLPHLAQEQMKKDAAKLIEGEKLDVLIGSRPIKLEEEKEEVKENIKKILLDKYNIEEDDFLSSEIEVVPAGKARDFGLDRSMIMSYGQDDRSCAFASYKAFLEIENPTRTTSCILVDKEEIGSVGSTGMESHFYDNAIAEICELLDKNSHLAVRRVLRNSYMLSSDVNAAYDPLYSEVMDKNNASFFGKGVTFSKFTGSRGKSSSNDADAEYIAKIRKVMDDNNVTFQMAELGKVDIGGGGTIAYILANYNVSVIDCGIGVLSMHAPWEVTSKSDLYEAFKCYKAFLKEIK